MTYIINLGKAWFHVNNRHTCDHRVDASINTMKYLNSPHNGCIGPQISPWILSSNFSGSVCILRGEGLKINFLVAHVVYMKSEVYEIWLLLNYALYNCQWFFSSSPHQDIPAYQARFECINILENHFIRNMWNRFYVCVI
jgi:hypothetical protein